MPSRLCTRCSLLLLIAENDSRAQWRRLLLHELKVCQLLDLGPRPKRLGLWVLVVLGNRKLASEANVILTYGLIDGVPDDEQDKRAYADDAVDHGVGERRKLAELR